MKFNKMKNMKEVWKDVKGYKGLYQVSSEGRVKSLDRAVRGKSNGLQYVKGRILTPYTSHDGYLKLKLSKDGNYRYLGINRLVAEAFIPNVRKLTQVNHLNCNKKDNSIGNLEWCSPSANIVHAYANGLIPQGEDSHYATISNEIAHAICGRLEEKVRVCDIVSEYCVSRFVISKIKNKKSWKHISKHYNF